MSSLSGISIRKKKVFKIKTNDMKIRLFPILALAGLFLAGCAVDELPVEGGSILAEMENDLTRTSVTDEGAFTWSEGDQVWLHTTEGGIVGTLSSGAGTSSAQFAYGAFFGDMTGKAIYPYNSGHSVSEDQISVVLPASYDLGSILSNTNAAMYGEVAGGTIKFNHLAGVMRFVFKNVPAGTNKFQITLDKKINGTFTADLSADYPVIETAVTSTASEKTVTLNFDALTKVSDISLYVPLPLGTYTTLGLDLWAGSQSVWSYSNTVTNTIGRKTLKLMPAVSMGGSIGGDIEGNESSEPEVKVNNYIDEYGIDHGPGVEIDGVVWAPVNCGHHATDCKGGKLYQWGRKYGQVGPTLRNGPVSLSVGQSSANADIFYCVEDSDWLDTPNDALWNAGTTSDPVKTEYDPCPTGWRVPTSSELAGLVQNKSSWNAGYWFSGSKAYSTDAPRIFLSAEGYRDLEGESGYSGREGHYWTSTPKGKYARCLAILDVTMDMSLNYDRGFGRSVRCVAE